MIDMSDNLFNRRRPTPIEDQAHADVVRHFSEHLKQFPVSRDAVKKLERDIAKTALVALAASQKPPQGNPFLADDGTQWHKCVDLFDNTFVGHRAVAYGTEFAVVEHVPASGKNEILARGRNAVDVLKSFAHDQRHALQIWTEDVSAQVKEFLAEKYPGHDTSRVVTSLVHKLATQAAAQNRATVRDHQQNRSRGIGI